MSSISIDMYIRASEVLHVYTQEREGLTAFYFSVEQK